MTITRHDIDPILLRLRTIDGFESARLSGSPQPITGGFWATLLLAPLDDAVVPAVVVRLMPDRELAVKETVFQTESARQGLAVPTVYLADELGPTEAFMVMEHAPGSPAIAGLEGIGALVRVPRIARSLPRLLGSVMAQVHRLDTRPFLAALEESGLSTDPTTLLEHWRAWAEALGRDDLCGAADRLAAARPAPTQTVVCHGDLHPLNLLVDGGTWTLLDWTAAVIAEPAYDIAFTSLLLRHPPLPLPRLLRPAISAAGNYVARGFQTAYAASGTPLPDAARLDWYTALHSLRILLEVETWRQEGTSTEHAGHPWLSIGPHASHALSQVAKLPVASWRS